ncbi:unnamed protein product [Mortierella alpina]
MPMPVRISHNTSRTIRDILKPNAEIPQIPSEDTAARRNLQKLRDFYASCMDEAQLRRVGRQPLLDEIRTIVNLFPVKGSPFEALQNTTHLEASGRPLMNATSGIFPQALSETLGYFYKLGLYAFASLTTRRASSDAAVEFLLFHNHWNLKPSLLYSVAIGQDVFAQHGDQDAVAKTLWLLMRPEDDSSFDSDGAANLPSEGVPEIWSSTAINAIFVSSRIQDMNYASRRESIQRLSNLAVNINMTLSLQQALPDDVDLPSNVTLSGFLFGVIDEFLATLEWDETPQLPLRVQSYLVWMVVKQMVRQIDPRYGQFLRPLNDLGPNRWRYCTGVVNSALGKMVAPFFVQTVSSEHETAQGMVDSIRGQLVDAYERIAGLDKSTKARGLKKLNESLSFVGIDNTSYTAEVAVELEDYHRYLTFDRTAYFWNRKNYAMWIRQILSGVLRDMFLGIGMICCRRAAISFKTRSETNFRSPPVFYDSLSSMMTTRNM